MEKAEDRDRLYEEGRGGGNRVNGWVVLIAVCCAVLLVLVIIVVVVLLTCCSSLLAGNQEDTGSWKDNSSCPTGFQQHKMSCYKPYPRAEVTFSQAKQKCSDTGTYLVVLETEDEYDWLILQDEQRGGDTWIDSKVPAAEDSWMTVKAHNAAEYYNSPPNGQSGGDRCVVISYKHGYEWRKITCEAGAGFVCETESRQS